MKKSVKITTSKIMTSLVGLCLGMLLLSRPVMAEGNLNATVDKETCELGESVKLSIEAQIPDGAAVPPQIAVEYNPNRLQFDNCSCEYGGGGGGFVSVNEKSATFDFTTLSGGEAEFKVSGILSEDSGEIETVSVKVSVNGEDTAVGTDAPPASSTGVEAGVIETGDGRVVQTVFADEFMPSLFHKETCDYQGQTIECAKFDMGDMTLLYSSDSSGNDGKFMIYNTATGEMSDFRMIQGIENRFIIVLSECEGELPPGYTKTVLEWNGQTLTAYLNVDAANGTAPVFNNLPASDFFLIYGLSSEGSKGWYQYDMNEGTYQRYFALAGDSVGSASGEEEDTNASGEKTFLDEYISRKVQMILLFVFAGLTLILLVVVIILAVRSSGYDDYGYGDDYYGDEEEDDEADEERTGRSKPGTITAASIVTSQMGEIPEDDEEDDGEDEEDEEDDEEYYESRMSRRELKEARREEKWRQKEEKKAAKLRAKGYEEATPMDWSSFKNEESSEEDDDERRRYGKSRPPKYMQNKYEQDEETEDESAEEEEEDIPIYSTKKSRNIEEEIEENAEEDEDAEEEPPYVSARKPASLPPRKKVSVPEEDEADRRNTTREDEQRARQKRLFEQQQRIEEQQQLEKQRREDEQKREQQQFIEKQQMDEDLDEDFQFEFLNL